MGRESNDSVLSGQFDNKIIYVRNHILKVRFEFLIQVVDVLRWFVLHFCVQAHNQKWLMLEKREKISLCFIQAKSKKNFDFSFQQSLWTQTNCLLVRHERLMDFFFFFYYHFLFFFYFCRETKALLVFPRW